MIAAIAISPDRWFDVEMEVTLRMSDSEMRCKVMGKRVQKLTEPASSPALPRN